ncbi:MAG TPA: hypothetical protein VNF73_13950 [Candidatus Saccharimonadales bacterium]|nr:hypothetical protein [Candidatus Saccharimonadales bacterium]
MPVPVRRRGRQRSGRAVDRGRAVNETTCLNAVRIYHVRLDELGLLVSTSSLGAVRYGEQVIAGLRT